MGVKTRMLGCVLLLTQTIYSSDALRSCTRMGQAVVPCEDELVLEQHDRFLVTFFGHSCYSIDVVSTAALDVYFYDTYGWSKQIGPKARKLRAITPFGYQLRGATNWAESMQICRHTQDCQVKEVNRSAHTQYDLVIARSTPTTASLSNAAVHLRIESCDAVSKWFYVGLAATAVGGFFTMLILLCILSEFLLGVHAYAHLRKKLGFGTAFHHQFVELAQFDPLEAKDASDSNHPKKRHSILVTSEPGDTSDDEDMPVPLQRNHSDATSHCAATEA